VELSGRTVLVTGAHGLLGAWLVRALLAAGARVVAIRRDEPAISALALLDLAQSVDVVHGDICEPGLIARAVSEYEADTVFHLAAQTQVGTANRAPLSTFETNIRGTWLLLEACRTQRVRSVIVASSDKAYGPQAELPYREHQPLAPIYPYDVSKAAADLLARSYWHTFALPVAVTRCAERDFLYIEDAVAAYLAIWRALESGQGRGEAFNAGGGQPHRVLDVVELVCELAGGGLAPEIRGQGVPSGEIDRQWVDAGKLRELTGWEPQVTLAEGLARTVQWYREHPAALSR
jgi:CDP-glucose 4,6-dehydratase